MRWKFWKREREAKLLVIPLVHITVWRNNWPVTKLVYLEEAASIRAKREGVKKEVKKQQLIHAISESEMWKDLKTRIIESAIDK